MLSRSGNDGRSGGVYSASDMMVGGGGGPPLAFQAPASPQNAASGGSYVLLATPSVPAATTLTPVAAAPQPSRSLSQVVLTRQQPYSAHTTQAFTASGQQQATTLTICDPASLGATLERMGGGAQVMSTPGGVTITREYAPNAAAIVPVSSSAIGHHQIHHHFANQTESILPQAITPLAPSPAQQTLPQQPSHQSMAHGATLSLPQSPLPAPVAPLRTVTTSNNKAATLHPAIPPQSNLDLVLLAANSASAAELPQREAQPTLSVSAPIFAAKEQSTERAQFLPISQGILPPFDKGSIPEGIVIFLSLRTG